MRSLLVKESLVSSQQESSDTLGVLQDLLKELKEVKEILTEINNRTMLADAEVSAYLETIEKKLDMIVENKRIVFTNNFIRKIVEKLKDIDETYQTLGDIPMGIVRSNLVPEYVDGRLFKKLLNKLQEDGYIKINEDNGDVILL